MPFTEYRGSGKSDHDITRMPVVWDKEWSGIVKAPRISESSEHWPHIRQLMKPGGRLLEAGCGLAKWVQFLDDHGFDAYGLDFSPVAIERSFQFWPGLKDRLFQGDLRKTPFEAGFFDGIVSFGAIEHDPDGPDKALKEMLRILAPGGVMYCTVPCYNLLRRSGEMALLQWLVTNRTIRRMTGRKPDVSFYEYLFSPKEYRAHLEKAGFEGVELLPLSPRIDFLNTEGPGLASRCVHGMHRRWPWLMPHMMAGICRKPDAAPNPSA